MNEWFLFVSALVLAVGGGFFFSMAETAFSALRRWQIRSIASHEGVVSDKFRKLLSDRDGVLASFVLGNALCHGIFILCGLWIIIRLQWSPEYVFLAQFLFILFVTEVFPKSLVVSSPARWALRLQRLIVFSQALLGPITWALLRVNKLLFLKRVPESVKTLTSLTDNDIRQLLEVASHKGAIGIGEKEIISAIIDLDHQTADDVMNPRLELDGVEVTSSTDEILNAARTFRHRRLILFRQNIEHIVGFLNCRTYLLTQNLEASFEVPSYVPESINLLSLFLSLQKQRRGIAVVLDEFGTPSGIITMEDILEEIVGNIKSEGRPDEQYIKFISPGHWIVKGNARIEDFQDSFAPIASNDEVDTLAGLFLLEYQMIPKPGDSIQIGSFQFTILQADQKRILEMEIKSKRKLSPHPLNRFANSSR